MKFLKKTLITCSLALAGLVGISSTAQAVIITDIIMMVDESGSMANVQANLRANVGTFASILSAGGIDARYGLVGYGGPSSGAPRMHTDLTSAVNFATAAGNLVASGGTEPGYAATAFALNSLDGQADLFSFRNNALKNIIIFTDEPSNGDFSYDVGGAVVTRISTDQLLTATGALFNAVLRDSDTISSYQDLALDHSGQVFDLNGLNTTDQTVVQNFVDSFAKAKLQEILDFCALNPNDPACNITNVPEPASLVLLGLGLLGLRRRQKMAA